MHRVDNKRRQAAILRIVAYTITIVLTIVTTTLLLYVALGYRLGSSGHVVKNGLLLVDNRPQSARVYINDEQKDASAPSRFVLPAGDYRLALKLNGYHDWSKHVQVSASKVREVHYPLLIPTRLTQVAIGSLAQVDTASQSGDRKLLLVYSAAGSQFTLIELDPEKPVLKPLTVGSAVRREAGSIGSIRVIEWSLNNKNVLFEQTLPSGEKDLISMDVTKPSEAINISTLYGDRSITDVHYVGSDTKRIYGLKNGIISRYDLESASQTIILQNVLTYTPYSNDTLLFSRASGDVQQIGIVQDTNKTIVTQAATSLGAAHLQYGLYDEHYYFVVSFDQGEAITVFRDPLKKPILAKQLPYTTLSFSGPKNVVFSGSSQFFLVHNGKRVMVYDLEDVMPYVFEVPFELAAGSAVTWVDDHHIQAVAADATSYIFDYDGTNKQALSAARAGSRLYYSNNFEDYYSLTDGAGNVQLSSTGLVAKKQ